MLIKSCFVLLFLALCVAAQEAALEAYAPDDQLKFADPELQDKLFDDSLLNKQDRPSVAPRQEEVERLLKQPDFSEEKLEAEATREDQVARAKRSTSLQSVNLYVKYFQYSDWYINYKSCCPKSQYYGCGVTRALLHPCFYHWHNGRIEWCSIIYPTVYMVNCNCRTCVKQCPERGCFATGKCYRQYKLQKLYAVCYRNGWWDHIHIFYRYVPSGCYCGARCG